MARNERADVSAGRGSARAAGAGAGFVRRNDGSTSPAAAFVGAAALAGAPRGGGVGFRGRGGGAVCAAVGAGSRVTRTGAGGALPGGGAGLCGLGVGVCVAVGAGSRIVPAGGGAGCGAAGARAVTGVASRVAESAAVGAEFAVAAAFGIELAVSAEVFGAELAGVAGLSAATRLVALVLTRARRASAGFAKSEFSDCASGEGLAMVFAEDARRRTGAGVGGAVSDALPPVGATLGLRLRGAFGRSASSMRRSLAASEHGEPCARLC